MKTESTANSKSYEQLLIDICLCSKRMAPDAIAHCAFKLTHDIATTPQIPPTNVFYWRKINYFFKDMF